MDFDAVKRASGADLVECAIAAVANGRGLLEDAEMLSLAGRLGRASALAVLAVEEVGKGVGMTLLSFLPQHMRRNREAGRLLEWHGLKLAGGIILALLPAAWHRDRPWSPCRGMSSSRSSAKPKPSPESMETRGSGASTLIWTATAGSAGQRR